MKFKKGLATLLATLLTTLVTPLPTRAQTSLEAHFAVESPDYFRIVNEHHGDISNVSFIELYDNGSYFAKTMTTLDIKGPVQAIAQSVHIGKDNTGQDIPDVYGAGIGIKHQAGPLNLGIYALPTWYNDSTFYEKRATLRAQLYTSWKSLELFAFFEPRIDKVFKQGYGEAQAWWFKKIRDIEIGLTYNPAFILDDGLKIQQRFGITTRF